MNLKASSHAPELSSAGMDGRFTRAPVEPPAAPPDERRSENSDCDGRCSGVRLLREPQPLPQPRPLSAFVGVRLPVDDPPFAPTTLMVVGVTVARDHDFLLVRCFGGELAGRLCEPPGLAGCSSAFDKPKSPILALPSALSMMFSGLRSRCASCAPALSCRYDMPCATSSSHWRPVCAS